MGELKPDKSDRQEQPPRQWIQSWRGWKYLPDNTDEVIKLRRSRVRMWITYGAGLFLFGGGAAFIACLIWVTNEKILDVAREVFAILVPIATGVITYWFADQRSEGADEPKKPDTTTRGGTGSDDTDKPQQAVARS